MTYIVAKSYADFDNYCRRENIAIARLVQTTKQAKQIGRISNKDTLILLVGHTDTEIGRGTKLIGLRERFELSGAEIRYDTK